MLKKIIIISSIVALVLLTILLNITNPASAGPFGILILFVSVYVIFVGLITGLICILSKIVSRFIVYFYVETTNLYYKY